MVYPMEDPVCLKPGPETTSHRVQRRSKQAGWTCWQVSLLGLGKARITNIWELTSGAPCQADALEKEMAMPGWRMPGKLQSKTEIWMNTQMCRQVGTHTHRHPCTHARTQAPAHAHRGPSTQPRTLAHSYPHTHACKHIHKHAPMHALGHPHVHADAHTSTHAHATHAHKRTRAQARTHHARMRR